MKPPEVVVFDLGKVLLDFDYGIAVKRIAARCNGSHCDLPKLLSPEAALLCRYESGALTTELFFAELQKASGFLGELTEFSGMFGDIFTEISTMVHLNETLRARGIPTYIFSNTNPLAINHIRNRFPFFAKFDDYILSYEHGAMKPQEKIYKVVEKISGKSAQSILYIDDRLENIEAGMKRGWRTILQEHPEKTVRQIGSVGLL